jgi:hypothetical protein
MFSIFLRLACQPKLFSKRCRISRRKTFTPASDSHPARSTIRYWSRDPLGRRQLPPSIAEFIERELVIPAISVRRLGMTQAKDREIFEAAKVADSIILTKDSDFVTHLNHRVSRLRCYGYVAEILRTRICASSSCAF